MDPSFINTEKRLFARDSAGNEHLQSRLASVLQLNPSFAHAGHEALVLQDPRGTGHIRIVILPQRGSSNGFDEIRAVLSIDSSKTPPSRARTLARLYRLSVTECRIADLLLTGKELKEAGELLNLTQETTRFYVKRILNKTGLRRQSDLIRLMSGLPGQC